MADARQNNGGRRAGSGRKRIEAKERFIKLMDAAITDEDLLQILEVTKATAKAGNQWAVEFFFDRLFGKPVSKNEIEIDAAIAGLLADVAGTGKA